jgi:hypothetical protein
MSGQHFSQDIKILLAMCITWLGHGAPRPHYKTAFDDLQSLVLSSAASGGGGLITRNRIALHRRWHCLRCTRGLGLLRDLSKDILNGKRLWPIFHCEGGGDRAPLQLGVLLICIFPFSDHKCMGAYVCINIYIYILYIQNPIHNQWIPIFEVNGEFKQATLKFSWFTVGHVILHKLALTVLSFRVNHSFCLAIWHVKCHFYICKLGKQKLPLPIQTI